ncbi:hypothetical protein HK101_010408 [Irineochytrium annulatum]|nr:hypothetical protein HK101_010408 [Irineochytrium annulatum]
MVALTFERFQLKAIRAHGLKNTFKQYAIMDQPRVGKLVGKDQFGNEYYENRDDIVVRDRWVMYKRWNYDPTQVPPEWHQWLHRITDDVPNETTVPIPAYTPPYQELLTGTSSAFKTYSTVKPKVQAWEPQVKERGL